MCTFRKKNLHNYKHLHENRLGLLPKTGVLPLHAATKFLGLKQYTITLCINFTAADCCYSTVLQLVL